MKLIDFAELLQGMRSRLRDNKPGSSCGDVFLKTRFHVEFCIRIRFLKRKNPVDTLIKTVSKRIDLKALTLFVSSLEFDELLVLKFQYLLACQSYRLDKSMWKNFISVFHTWNWNNHQLVHLWKVYPFPCFSMVTATC